MTFMCVWQTISGMQWNWYFFFDLLPKKLQVLASKSKIYMVLEYVTGGELFDKIVRIPFPSNLV